MKNTGLLESTLSAVTLRYINNKYQFDGNDLFEKKDLRHMCENVVAELESIEKEAAFDYLKVENEVNELNDQITRSDAILEELEKMLLSFRDNLYEIKTEMTSLQDRSIQMNTCLSNRKKLQDVMTTFMKSAVLEPSLIEDICNKEINESYVDYIKLLCQKIEYLKTQNLNDSSAGRELEPELLKLKNKACARVRAFLMEKINLLKKPKTNIQIMQKNVLLKYKIFTQFLGENYKEVYIELCNIYSDIMARFYFTNFKTYVGEINKLYLDIYSKTDILINENPQLMKNMVNTRGTNYTQNNKSIFALMNREEILNQIESDPILYHVASQANQRFLVEQMFRSLNKLLLDSVASEYFFTLDFFNLKNDQNKVVFSGVFKSTLTFTTDYIKNLINYSFDCYGLLLIFLINERNKRAFNIKGLTFLDSYFETINMIIWPRFETIFDIHLNSITSISLKNFKLLERSLGTKFMILRYIDFSIGLYKLYTYFEDNKMLLSRINRLKNYFYELVHKSSDEIPFEKDRNIYLILTYDTIWTSFIFIQGSFEKKEFQDDLLFLEKKTNIYINNLVESIMKEFFNNLVEFVKKYAKEDNEAEISSLNLAGDNLEVFVENSGKLKQNENYNAINFKLIENINTELSESWLKRIEAVKSESEKIFAGQNCLKLIVKKFLTNLLAYYNTFYKYVKNYYPNYISSMIPVHQIMKEVKNSMKKYNIS